MTTYEFLQKALEEAHERIVQLKQENAELRKNAERYRWLKNMFGWHILRDYPVDVESTNLDAAIDTAIKEQT